MQHGDFDVESLAFAPEWSEAHEDEKKFQLKKQEKQMIEALNYDVLVGDEVTEELREKARLRKKKDEHNDQVLIADKERVAAAVARGHVQLSWDDVRGKHYWMAASDHAADLKMQAHGVVRTHDRWKADVFIVPNAAQPPERVHWIAVLCGKMILDLKCLKNENGILLHYNAACMKPLQIHVTSDFKSQHSSIVAILSKARLSMGKQWHFSKAQTGKVHLATTSECDGKDPKKWFNKKSFLRMVSKLDKQWSGNLDRLQ